MFKLLLFVVLFMFSCKKQTIAIFEIENNSSVVVDSTSISIIPEELETEVISIAMGEKKLCLLDMSGIPKVDGDYLLQYRPNGTDSLVKINFGYFPNGMPMEKITKIKIIVDSVIIDSKYYLY